MKLLQINGSARRVEQGALSTQLRSSTAASSTPRRFSAENSVMPTTSSNANAMNALQESNANAMKPQLGKGQELTKLIESKPGTTSLTTSMPCLTNSDNPFLPLSSESSLQLELCRANLKITVNALFH